MFNIRFEEKNADFLCQSNIDIKDKILMKRNTVDFRPTLLMLKNKLFPKKVIFIICPSHPTYDLFSSNQL